MSISYTEATHCSPTDTSTLHFPWSVILPCLVHFPVYLSILLPILLTGMMTVLIFTSHKQIDLARKVWRKTQKKAKRDKPKVLSPTLYIRRTLICSVFFFYCGTSLCFQAQFLEVRMISLIQWHTISQAQEFSVCEYQQFLTKTSPKLKT